MQEEFAKDLGGLPQLYNSWTGALMDLQQNKIDAVIIADVSGEEYLKTMKGIKKIDVVEENFPGASIALRKGETELVPTYNFLTEKDSVDNINSKNKISFFIV